MSDSESDDEDIFADFEDDDADDAALNVSANLLETAGARGVDKPVHQGDVDEGRITWQAPTFNGLENSHDVTVGTKHWYKEEATLNTETTFEAKGFSPRQSKEFSFTPPASTAPPAPTPAAPPAATSWGAQPAPAAGGWGAPAR